MKWFTATLCRSCNALVIVALLLGGLPPAQNVGYPRFELPIAHAQEETATPLEEGMAPPDGPSGQLSVAKAEPGVVGPSDLITYTVALGAVDEPAPLSSRASGGLLATKTAEPEVASPGNLITYTIALTNTTRAAMEGLVVNDPLPDGLAYVPGSAEGGEYDPRTHTLTWEVRELAAGASLSFRFQARVRGDVLGDLVVNRAEVTGRGLADPVQAQATVAVVSRALITSQGGTLVSRSGRVRVEFPAGAVRDPIWAIYHLLEARQVPASRTGLALRLDLTTRVATDEITAPSISQFEKPVRLTMDMTGLVDEAAVGQYQRLFVGYLDEATGRWVHLPIVEQQVGPVLTVEVDHFSTFGGGVEGGEEGFQADFIPSVANAQPALFTGDATYALPLYVPPGPGGLQPDLTLRYSSGDVSEAWLTAKKSGWERSHLSQPGWLGQGWSLNFGVIVRDMKGQELKNAEWSTHAYWLNMNSASGRLVKASDGYYYPEFAPQWRLDWTEGNGPYTNGTWTAYGPDGTKYTFAERM